MGISSYFRQHKRRKVRTSLYALFTLLIITCCLPAVGLYAQAPNLESLTAADGLSQGMIFDLLQDRKGFLWFATKDGLNRYDGYTFRAYQNDPFDPFSISGNEIQGLFEDHFGRLWIGTANSGLDVFDPQTGLFYHLRTLAGQRISCFAETFDGSVWVGTDNGARRVLLPARLPADSPDLLAVAQVDAFYWDNLENDNQLPPNQINDLATDRTGKLWVSTNLQIGCFDPGNARFQTIFPDLRKLSKDGEPLPAHLFSAPDSSIWVGHPDRLLHIGRDGNTDAFPLPERSPFPLTDLAFDAAGKLFVSTRKQIFTLQAEAIKTPVSARFDLFYRFPAEGILGSTKLLFDRGGLLWIGTNGYGLRKYNPGDRRFRHFAPALSLRRIACDAQGRTWVWRNGGKFHRLDEAGNRLAEPLLDEPNILQHDCIADRNGALWLLCESTAGKQGAGLLIKIDPKTLRPMARFPLPGRVSILSQMKEDQAGNICIIGNESTLITFNQTQNAFETADFSAATGFREFSFCLNEDAAGHWWIGTPHGLVRGIPGQGGMTFSLYKNNPADRNSLNCDVVLSTLDDPMQPERYLWVGAWGGGLNRLDKTSGQVRHFTTAEGLPNNVVYAILPERPAPSGGSGALWLSTNCGLAKFDPQSAHFQNFFATDGLQDNEFNTASFARASDGRLFFGGVNGLTAFYPQEPAATAFIPAVFLTALKIQNHLTMPGDGILEKSVEETTDVTLSYYQNQLTFEFAAMDFSTPKQNQYRYRLIGADRDWVEPTTANTATYANLAPGHYVFEIFTGGSHGVWNGAPARLDLHILPPWWRTSGAWLFYFLAITGALWAFYRFQINKIRLQNDLAFEHREVERLAELDRLKTNFFSSVTHEFRTPLTLLIEPTRQLLAETQDRAARYRLELIEKSARRLLQFVNQLLDLSKLDAGQMPLDLRPGSPSEAIRAVAETFQPLASQKEITLDISLPREELGFVFDQGKLDQVVANLLSNAFKFTGKGGKVEIVSHWDIEKSGHSDITPPQLDRNVSMSKFPNDIISPSPNFIIKVSDTGIGIPVAALPLVFNRFYQLGETSAQGTGIGLALTKELVERMGGSISVESRQGQGTTFTVELPGLPAGAGRLRLKASSAKSAEEASLGLEEGAKNAKVDGVNPEPGTSEGLNAASHAVLAAENPLILLIEDDQELRQFLRASLPPQYRIAEAADGEEGIRMAFELVPDLVVSDLMMPEKDGFEVAETLKNDPRSSHIPLILLTAKSAVESRIEGLRRGADAYLTKPFRADELVAHIESLIATRRRLQSVFSKTVKRTSVLESAVAAFETRENEFLRRLMDVVEENLDNDAMDAEMFARTVHMSRSQLHRKISALTGLPLTEFVRNYRLDRASDMLARREGSVSEIAWRTGFSNAKYFSTCFRERFGQSPSMFRAEG